MCTPAEYYAQARPEIQNLVPRNCSTLLDIGCGEGAFSEAMKKKGVQAAWGIEIVPTAAEKAAQKLDRVFVGPVEQHLDQLPQGYFDCIVANDVLEHLVDPFDVLVRLKKNLKPQGVIVSSIPNIRYFLTLWDLVIHKQWQYKDSGILDRTHLRFFTERSIKTMFEDLGFNLLSIKGIEPIQTRWFKALNLATLGFFNDTQYPQFASVVTPRETLPFNVK